jgi:hypothetical protein
MRHERSQERLSQAQSLQAASGIAARACRSLRKGNKQSRATVVVATLAMASITAISMAAGPTPCVGKIQSNEREGGNREGKSDDLFHCAFQ